MPPLFKSERDLLDIANNPKKLSALRDVVDSATRVFDNSKPCKTLDEWFAVSEVRIPEFQGREKFVEALGNLINEYSNEPETN